MFYSRIFTQIFLKHAKIHVQHDIPPRLLIGQIRLRDSFLSGQVCNIEIRFCHLDVMSALAGAIEIRTRGTLLLKLFQPQFQAMDCHPVVKGNGLHSKLTQMKKRMQTRTPIL